MELNQTLVNAFVIGAVGGVLAFMVSGFRREVRAEIAALRAEMHEEIRGVRSDLTQVALRWGRRPGPRASRRALAPASFPGR